jgi:adenylate cyclase
MNQGSVPIGDAQTGAPDTAPEADVLRDAFARETRRGVQLSVFGRLAIFALFLIAYVTDAHGNYHTDWFRYRMALIAIAVVSGLINYLISRRAKDPARWSYGFFVVDAAVIVGLVFGWLPPIIADYPQFLAVRYQDVLIFAAILCMSVFPLSERLITFAGVAMVSIWLIGLAESFLRTDGARTDVGIREAAHGWDDLLMRITAPKVLMLEYVALQVILLIALSALLILGVRRGRDLVRAAVKAEGESAFLARFFPPAVAAEIARRGAASLPTTRGEVAVLFADFDRGAADLAGIERMQAWYAVVEKQVFEHGGLIDRFVGDPVMAVFGAPTGGPDDGEGRAAPGDSAESAMACAEAVLEKLKRAGFSGSAAGINFGEAVSGEVGSERQRAFGVVGDTVNLAKRMLDAARDAGRELCASDRLMSRVDASAHPGFARLDALNVRGQAQPMTVWTR